MAQESIDEWSCHGPKVTQQQIHALVGAVTDELYARHRNPLYIDLPVHDSVLLYVSPKWCGRILFSIYKLLPVGEVLRGAWYVGKRDSLMRLATPLGSDEFAPTATTALRTIYLRDRDVAFLKASWKHVWFSVEITPDSIEVEAAKRRQIRRDSM